MKSMARVIFLAFCLGGVFQLKTFADEVKNDQIHQKRVGYLFKLDLALFKIRLYCGLSRNTSIEDVEKEVARRYGLPETAVFEDIRKEQIRLGEYSEEKFEKARKDWCHVFDLPEQSPWSKIREVVIREFNKYKKIK
jgi:hypothetical protein